MALTCVPPDLDAKNKKEAKKLVGGNPSIIRIDVPEIDDETVMTAYREKQEAKIRAFETGYAPLCTPEERWGTEGFPKKCAFYCPVKDACQELSRNHGERHPLDSKRTEENAEVAA